MKSIAVRHQSREQSLIIVYLAKHFVNYLEVCSSLETGISPLSDNKSACTYLDHPFICMFKNTFDEIKKRMYLYFSSKYAELVLKLSDLK